MRGSRIQDDKKLFSSKINLKCITPLKEKDAHIGFRDKFTYIVFTRYISKVNGMRKLKLDVRHRYISQIQS